MDVDRDSNEVVIQTTNFNKIQVSVTIDCNGNQPSCECGHTFKSKNKGGFMKHIQSKNHLDNLNRIAKKAKESASKVRIEDFFAKMRAKQKDKQQKSPPSAHEVSPVALRPKERCSERGSRRRSC